MSITLYFDGASRGNPGKAGAGALLVLPDGTQKKLMKPLGIATNNQAEYQALILGLRELVTDFPDIIVEDLHILGDSQLVIKQLEGKWRVKSSNIRKHYQQAKQLLDTLQNRGIDVTLQYISREKNTKADKLANKGADKN